MPGNTTSSALGSIASSHRCASPKRRPIASLSPRESSGSDVVGRACASPIDLRPTRQLALEDRPRVGDRLLKGDRLLPVVNRSMSGHRAP